MPLPVAESLERRIQPSHRNMLFEQVDERFEFVQELLGILLVAAVASPFVVEGLCRRREDQEQKLLDEVQRFKLAMRHVARKDKPSAKP